jgi:hypothetical protein
VALMRRAAAAAMATALFAVLGLCSNCYSQWTFNLQAVQIRLFACSCANVERAYSSESACFHLCSTSSHS